MTQLTRNELLELKDQIDKSKTTEIQMETRLGSLMEDMKEKWDCATVEEAKEKIEELNKELLDDHEELKKELEEIGDMVDNIEEGDSEEDYEL